MYVTENRVEAQLCLDSFEYFCQYHWDVVIPETPVWNWHIPFMCNEAQTICRFVLEGKPKEYDEVVNIAPGTTKSTIWSVMLPAWLLAKNPTMRSICGSYAYPLALDLSRKSRDIITSDKYRALFPHVKLREDQSAKGYFVTTEGGMRYAAAVGGSVMGMHAHIIIVDDPIDPSEAISELELERANHWMREVLPTRKVSKANTPTVLIMQRLHQADPTDLFLKRGKNKKVRHVCLPAELTDDVEPFELRKKYINGLFDPIRMPLSVLKEAEEDLGQYGYAGQYLQNPVPKGGGMFKTNRIKIQHPVGVRFVRTGRGWDKAGTSGGGAFTAGVKMARDEYGRFWILHCERFQKDSAEREIEISRLAHKDGYGCYIVMEQEGGSGGKESVESSVRRLAGFKVRKVKVGKSEGDKVDRADPFSVQVNEGNVLMVPGHWNEAYLEEMKHFPFGRYFDQMDASSNVFNFLHRKKRQLGAAF